MGAVVLYVNTALDTISELQDRFENTLATPLGPWSVELKLYRANPDSFGVEAQTKPPLYTFSASNHADSICAFTGDGELITDGGLVPILQSKLQSLWIPRQTFKGDGQSYQLDKCVTRVANIFVQGSFKGLVVQIEAEGTPEEVLAVAESVVTRYSIPGATPEKVAESLLETAKEYQKLNR